MFAIEKNQELLNVLFSLFSWFEHVIKWLNLSCKSLLIFIKLFLVPGKKCDQGFCYLLVCGTISVNGILKNHLRLLAHHQGDGREAELYKELYHHKQYKVRLPPSAPSQHSEESCNAALRSYHQAWA